MIAVRKARTTEELDTLREPFSADGNKKTKVQLALERGLGPLGVAIVTGVVSNSYALPAHWSSFHTCFPGISRILEPEPLCMRFVIVELTNR